MAEVADVKDDREDRAPRNQGASGHAGILGCRAAWFLHGKLSLTLKDFLPARDLLHTVAQWFSYAIWFRHEGVARIRGRVVDRQGIGPFTQTLGACDCRGSHAVCLRSFPKIAEDRRNQLAPRLPGLDRRAATIRNRRNAAQSRLDGS